MAIEISREVPSRDREGQIPMEADAEGKHRNLDASGSSVVT
jgi:hypothetical protein